MNDIINGSLEFIAGLFSIINIIKIVKDKEIKGVSWLPVGFFTLWGGWNLYYYPSLDQLFSFIGGIFMFVVNLTWIILVFHYSKKNKK